MYLGYQRRYGYKGYRGYQGYQVFRILKVTKVVRAFRDIWIIGVIRVIAGTTVVYLIILYSDLGLQDCCIIESVVWFISVAMVIAVTQLSGWSLSP